MTEALKNCLGRRRAAVGLRQQELAARVGISRQTLSALEAGRSVPSTAVALQLARALGCKVEELFWVDDARARIPVEVAADDGAPADPPAAGGRVVIGSIDGRWVAHRLSAGDPGSFVTAADGVLAGRPGRDGRSARVAPLVDPAQARDTLLCAGCAPAFGVLAARASAGSA